MWIVWNKEKAVLRQQITEERKKFAMQCLPVYEKYYPEVLEEIKGIADGQQISYEDL